MLSGLALSAMAGDRVSEGDDHQAVNLSYWQCVTFARARSGVNIHGDAWTWWSQAKGHYDEGHSPKVGAVLVFRPQGRMSKGHVAVVSQILTDRVIQVTHANWSPIEGRRGRVEENVNVVDVSDAGDWSQVKVWYNPQNDLGTTVYSIYGFVYPKSGSDVGPDTGKDGTDEDSTLPRTVVALNDGAYGATSFSEPTYHTLSNRLKAKKPAETTGGPEVRTSDLVTEVLSRGTMAPSAPAIDETPARLSGRVRLSAAQRDAFAVLTAQAGDASREQSAIARKKAFKALPDQAVPTHVKTRETASSASADGAGN